MAGCNDRDGNKMIEFHDSKVGIPAREAQARLMNGWLVVPGIAIDEPTVITPGQPDPIKKVDAWIPPMYGATVPQLIVIKAMLFLVEKEQDVITLDNLAKLLFKRPLSELRKMVVAETPTEEGAIDAD